MLQQIFASFSVMSFDLREQGPKKKKEKERNHNKGVAGDFLMSSICMCMFGMQPSCAQAHFTISSVTSN